MKASWGLVATLLVVGAPAVAGQVAVADLVVDGARWNGEIVTIEGELVGDFQRRGEWTWVQLNGDSYADVPAPEGGELTGANVGVAVRIRTDALDVTVLDAPGRYGVRGPIVRVTGEWRHRDEDRGGESYLAASTLELLEGERRFEEPMPWGVLIAGLALLGLAGSMGLVSRRHPRNA